MNFLAHLFLSSTSDDALIGALLGDFVKGPLTDGYPRDVMHGIRLHRRIDVFTDAHPAVLASKSRVTPVRRRYAGIMVDMFYDHFLARRWDDYADEDLASFVRRVYALMNARRNEFPERLQRMTPPMIEFDWLGSYREVDSIGVALDRMGRRLTRGNGLLGSAEDLVRDYAGFEQDFRTFFPDVMAFARSQVAG